MNFYFFIFDVDESGRHSTVVIRRPITSGRARGGKEWLRRRHIRRHRRHPFASSLLCRSCLFSSSLLCQAAKPSGTPTPSHRRRMATLRSAPSSAIAHSPGRHPSLAGMSTSPLVVCSINSTFNGISLQLSYDKRTQIRISPQASRTIKVMAKPAIQFIQGTDEQTIPDVRLTKSRDGTNGVATFIFEQPSVFDSSSELGDITGFYMIDEEGVLQSVDVSAKFVNGKPARLEAKYIMRNPREWDRFMRFMERYSEANDLQFFKK